MPFREKAKALFKKSRSSASSSKNSSSGDSSSERWPSNVYKPSEMPRPKYRQPPKKEHKDKLEAFSFADAWRRTSFQSQYSPMGTRAPSRRASFLSIARRKSTASAMTPSRGNSVTSCHTEKSNPFSPYRRREGHAALAPTLTNQDEASDDDDVANVGLSRVQSHSKDSHAKQTEHAPIKPIVPVVLNTAHDHQPFTEHELALALHRSNLAVPAN